MTDIGKSPEGSQNVFFADWVQNQANVWEQAWKQTAKLWQTTVGISPEKPGESEKPAGLDAVGTGLFNFFQALSSLTGSPKPDDLQDVKSTPDLMLKLIQPFWNYSIKLQKQWAEITGVTAEGQPESMAELFKQITKTLFEEYGEDFRKILNVPQLGLNRYYQERFNQAIEKASVFQSALADFLQLLMIPMERSYFSVQEEIARMEKEGKAVIKESQALYQLWIRKLEAHYMTLLRSEDYINTLRETLGHLHDYRSARAAFFTDLLRELPIPNNKDMDELYRDLHILKKRVKELERKVKQDAKR